MAIADLSISYQRELVVDFAMPFLDLGKLFTINWLNIKKGCS